MKRLTFIKKIRKNLLQTVVAGILLIVVGGAVVFAAQPNIAIQAENGALAGTAFTGSDGTASGSGYLGFNDPSSTGCTVSTPTRICWNGELVYLSGVNVPWYQWSYAAGHGDFGGGSSDGVIANSNAIAAEFAKLKDAGVHSVRWWVFEGGAYHINRDGSGLPTSLNNAIYADFDKALELAETYDLYYNFVLFSGVDGGQIPDSWRTNATHRQALANVLGPLFARYKDNKRVMGWEIINEPEWAIWNNSAVTEADVKNLTRSVIASIRTNSPGKLVTVGQSLIDGFNSSQKGIEMWTDVDLDYYSPHWYDPHTSPTDICALCTTATALQTKFNTSKPIVIGEYYQGGQSTQQNVDRQNQWYNQSYAGAWGWSLFWDMTGDKLKVDMPALKTFNQQHNDIGP